MYFLVVCNNESICIPDGAFGDRKNTAEHIDFLTRLWLPSVTIRGRLAFYAEEAEVASRNIRN